jgi:protein TonB
MRAGNRVIALSRPPRPGGGVLASLALHGGALAAALVGLSGGRVPAGMGEPVAVAMVFVAGPPAPASAGGLADGIGEAAVAADAAEPAPEPVAPVATDLAAADPEPKQTAETAADEKPAEPEPAAVADPIAPADAAEPIAPAAVPAPEPVAAPPPPPPPPPPRAAEAQPSPSRAAAPSRPVPPRTAFPPARGRQPGGGAAVGQPDAAGPSAPPVEEGPVLVSNPGFRWPPAPPAYPRQAIARGIEGTVMLRVLIGPDGETIEIRIHRSSGAVLLDQAAVEAVRRWAFRPAVVGGRAVPAWVEVPVRFRLD